MKRTRELGASIWSGAAVIGLVLAAVPAAGQAGAVADLEDGRWLPYLGCWVDVEDAAGPMTCVVPEGAGVAVLTVAGEGVVDRRPLVDGVDQAAELAGCTGVESAAFSTDGARVYTSTELSCGTGVERTTRGMITMLAEDRWMEARALDVGGGSVAWVKTFAPAPVTRAEAAGLTELAGVGRNQAVEAARFAAAGPITVDALIEATARTDAEAVRAWVAEQGDPIRLDAERLVRLDEAGVPAEIIDVAIAVSFPDRFDVARAPRDYRGREGGYAFDRCRSMSLWSPYSFGYSDPYCYDPFYRGYRYGYGYHSGYGYHPGYYGPGPTIVVVRPAGGDSDGRVVNGRGYTRGSTGDAAAPRGAQWSPPSGARRGTASVRGAGYSGSSGSSSKGKAKPRNSGGGNDDG